MTRAVSYLSSIFFALAVICFSAPGFAQQNTPSAISKPAFGGIYQHSIPRESETEAQTFMHLKFYPDGMVISVSSTGEAGEIKKWFSREHGAVSKGNYIIKNGKLIFTVASGSGTVAYAGDMMNGHINLTSLSLINGNVSDHTYTFITD